MREQPVEYADNETLLEAFVAWPDGSGPHPVVLVAHMWSGRCDFCCDKARALAKLGYVGFALDMFGKGVQGNSKAENAALIAPFKADRALLQRRVSRAAEVAAELPGVDSSQIAALGYCFGGLCVLDLARVSDRVKGVVSLHGDLALPNNIHWPQNQARVMIVHGHDDPLVLNGLEPAIKAQMTAAGVDWQFISFGQTVHAFTNPEANDPEFGAVYDAAADRRSWHYTRQFLAELFTEQGQKW